MGQRPKPLIGLNMDLKSGQASQQSVSFLFSGYYDAVMQMGGIPVVLPPYRDESDLEQVLSMLDGVIMVGGADLDPRRDGFMLHPSLRLMDERREEFDRMLINKVFEKRIPFFGIGAGMQLLNVTQGGTLFLHIPEDLARALPHRDAMDPYHRHALLVEKDSLFDRVYGDNEIRVNSIHHMAIDDVAPGFLVTARCPDSIIEGIESIRSDWFAFGTQFHPESVSATALDLRIFQEFVKGVIRHSDRCDESDLPVVAAFPQEAIAPKKQPVKSARRQKAAALFNEAEQVHEKARSRKIARA